MKASIHKLEWWKTNFSENYLMAYAGKYSRQGNHKEVEFIIKALHLSKKDRVLDLACGQGRHMV